MGDNNLNTDFDLIAILRGITPDDVSSMAEQLLSCGITQLEIPLNSPQALKSIENLSDEFGERIELGAGTVLDPDQVSQVKLAGAQYILTPNTNPQVIERCVYEGLTCFAGFSTATEALAAIAAGADGLKLFPAANFGVDYLKAIQAILPSRPKTYAVGGITLNNMHEWAGYTSGVGIGSSLYSPHISVDEFAQRCRAFSGKRKGIK